MKNLGLFLSKYQDRALSDKNFFRKAWEDGLFRKIVKGAVASGDRWDLRPFSFESVSPWSKCHFFPSHPSSGRSSHPPSCWWLNIHSVSDKEHETVSFSSEESGKKAEVSGQKIQFILYQVAW